MRCSKRSKGVEEFEGPEADSPNASNASTPSNPVMLTRTVKPIAITFAFLVSLLSLGAVSAVQTPTPRYPEAVLSNDQIRVRVYLPDPERGFYRSTRFDWSGVIASLEYQGHQYYGPWFTGTDPTVRDFIYKSDTELIASPQSAVTGPAEEFSRPQGFAEAKPGGTFVKVGVGVLRKKDDAAYSGYSNYDIVSTGQWEVEEGPGWIMFTQTVSDPLTGYAYEYRKTLRVTKGRPDLAIEHSLKNTGTKPIETVQYNHNFLTLDRATTGPGFAIVTTFPIQVPKPPDPAFAAVRGNEITYTKTLTGEERVSFQLEGYGKDASSYDIRVENRKTGAGVRITGDRPLARLPLWSIRSVLSIEPFVDVTTAPGETTNWKYLYSYYKNVVK